VRYPNWIDRIQQTRWNGSLRKRTDREHSHCTGEHPSSVWAIPLSREGVTDDVCELAWIVDVAALAEPLSVAWHAVECSDLKPGETALVCGAGPVGALIARWVNPLSSSHFSSRLNWPVLLYDTAYSRHEAAQQSSSPNHPLSEQRSLVLAEPTLFWTLFKSTSFRRFASLQEEEESTSHSNVLEIRMRSMPRWIRRERRDELSLSLCGKNERRSISLEWVSLSSFLAWREIWLTTSM